MSDTSTEPRPKLSPGRYRITNPDGRGWIAVHEPGLEVSLGRAFDRPEDVAMALMGLARGQGRNAVRVRNMETGALEGVIVDVGSLSISLTLSISPELDADLDNMAEELDTTKGGAVLKALALLKISLEAKREGKRVAIIDDRDDSEQDITGI